MAYFRAGNKILKHLKNFPKDTNGVFTVITMIGVIPSVGGWVSTSKSDFVREPKKLTTSHQEKYFTNLYVELANVPYPVNCAHIRINFLELLTHG